MSTAAGSNGPILLVGASGQIGSALAPRLARLGRVVRASRAELDLERPADIRAFVALVAPTLVVNAAAYTSVDEAERDEERCARINGDAPAILAQETARLGAAMVHFSTNYVFDGEQSAPYREEDPVSPVSVYGATKLEGERRVAAANPRHLLVRTSAVYDRRGRNFLRRILELARVRSELQVVDDQFVSPTPAEIVAEAVATALSRALAENGAWGTYHVTTRGSASWYEFATRILAMDPDRASHASRAVLPVPTSQVPTPARRPSNGVLDVTKFERTFEHALPDWEPALEQVMRGAGE